MKFDILLIFEKKPSEKIQVSFKSNKYNGYFTWRQIYVFYHISLSFREIQNTYFVFGDFFSKSCRLWDNVEKFFRPEKATDDNMAQAHCMTDN
jgi:hypothetical protein